MKNKKRHINITFLFAGLLIAPLGLSAQSESTPFTWALDNIILILGGLAIVAAAITVINLVFNFIDLQKMRILHESGAAPEQIVASTKVPSLKKLYDWAVGLVPISEEKNIDLGHDYDGIRELDNRLPPWWLGIMYGSVIFAIVYVFYFQWGPNDWSSIGEYEMAMEKAAEEKEAYLANAADVVDETNVTLATDEASLASGKDIYITSCLACHGVNGEGLVGPNFTDEYWVHGGDIKDLFKTIKYGVPEKGMISWSSQLSPSSMQNVASYILTMQGTDPPNQKAPEGELYVPKVEEVDQMTEDLGEQSEEPTN